ncbi:MAG: hypothetical protein ABW189_02870 [Rickettsiales bacterium]
MDAYSGTIRFMKPLGSAAKDNAPPENAAVTWGASGGPEESFDEMPF